MAKDKTLYTCTDCGGTSPKWQGKCPHCGAWNTLQEVRAEGGTLPETIEVEDLHRHAGAAELDVRAYPRDGGMLTSGIVTTALGGVGVFFGGFFALFGAMAERDGLVVAGGVTSAVGAVAVVPGIWMIVESGARTEITPVGFAPPSRLVEPPRFGFAASF